VEEVGGSAGVWEAEVGAAGEARDGALLCYSALSRVPSRKLADRVFDSLKVSEVL
jgi:hypothetical protein